MCGLKLMIRGDVAGCAAAGCAATAELAHCIAPSASVKLNMQVRRLVIGIDYNGSEQKMGR
jgi:hypothetical protein